MKNYNLDNQGQISAELILILGAMLIIVLTTSHYLINIMTDITNHSQAVISDKRDNIIGRL